MQLIEIKNNWNWEDIPFPLPDPIKNQINRINVPIYTHKVGTIYWGLSNHGKFTTKSMYSNLLQQELNSQIHTIPYNWIWKIPIPPKIKTFLWLIMHDKLPTTKYLNHIGVTLNDQCQICHTHPKSTNHLFLHCPNIIHIWHELVITHYQYYTSTLPSITVVNETR